MSVQWPEDGMLKTNGGEPFKTENAAKSAATTKGIPESEYRIVPYGGGFACEKVIKPGGEGQNDIPPPHVPSSHAQPAADKKTGYRKVIFNQRASENEPVDVDVAVNGKTLLLPRGTQTILPDSYLEAIRHTKVRTFRQSGPDMRKEVIEICPYVWVDLGPATEKEYKAMLLQGTEATKKKLERDGEIAAESFNSET